MFKNKVFNLADYLESKKRKRSIFYIIKWTDREWLNDRKEMKKKKKKKSGRYRESVVPFLRSGSWETEK